MLPGMAASTDRQYRAAPSAVAFMARALIRPGRSGIGAQPPVLAATWRGHRVAEATVRAVATLTGLGSAPSWPLLYPHVIGFRLQVAVLTDRAFPLPIWTSLQVRSHLCLHRPFAAGVALDLRTRVADQRVLDKGVEIDLHTTAHVGGSLHWEGVTTFYYRGRFGTPGPASPLATAPAIDGAEVAHWGMPRGGGVRFGRLTGDYNGIHLSSRYARLFGFPGAFLHPQRALGACLARLAPPENRPPFRLDAWLKGPVAYGADVALRAGAAGFALHVSGDERPAIVGRLGAG